MAWKVLWQAIAFVPQAKSDALCNRLCQKPSAAVDLNSMCFYGYRKKAKLREICQYCNKTSHASEDCPIKLAAEEGYGSEDAEISGSENAEDDAEPQSSSEPETTGHQPESITHAVPGRSNSYSPEVQASNGILQFVRLACCSPSAKSPRGNAIKAGSNNCEKRKL